MVGLGPVSSATAGLFVWDLAPPSDYNTLVQVPPGSFMDGDSVSSLPVPPVPGVADGALSFQPPMELRTVPTSWATWNHGYEGFVLWTGSGSGSDAVSIGFPDDTNAFLFYVEPNALGASTFDLTATFGSPAESTDTITGQSIDGNSGALGFLAIKDVDDVDELINNISLHDVYDEIDARLEDVDDPAERARIEAENERLRDALDDAATIGDVLLVYTETQALIDSLEGSGIDEGDIETIQNKFDDSLVKLDDELSEQWSGTPDLSRIDVTLTGGPSPLSGFAVGDLRISRSNADVFAQPFGTAGLTSATVVPEPTVLALLVTGGLVAARRARRRRRG